MADDPGLKRVLVTGPECSGKTTLARQLTEIYGATLIPEYAREYLLDLGRPYLLEDVLHIHKMQGEKEAEPALFRPGKRASMLIADTSSLVIDIWIRDKFGSHHPELTRAVREMDYDLILLCKPDLEWHWDPMREDPGRRDRLFQMYTERLDEFGKEYSLIQGQGNIRLELACKLVDQLP